jgi:DNA-directed RNA polymerase I subunit RPA1
MHAFVECNINMYTTLHRARRELQPRFLTSWEAEEMLKNLWDKEWRILALLFGPGGDGWGTATGGSRPGGRRLLRGVSLALDAGRLVARFSKAAEAEARSRWRMFFVRVLPVAPNKFRPPSIMGDTM